MPILPHLSHQIAHHAKQFPNQTAVKFLRGDSDAEILSYALLQQRIDSVAATVRQRVGVGEQTLLLYPQGLEFVPAFLGCLQAGVIAVPAYPPRRNRSQQRLVGIVKDCAPQLVLTTAEILPNVTAELAGGAFVLATDALPVVDKKNDCPEIKPTDIAYLLYTSGSTSEPKGTIITHEAVVQNIQHLTSAVGMRDQWNVVSWLLMHHDMGLVGTVLSPLYLGGRTTLMSPTTFLQNPFLWLETFTKERGNFIASPNFGFDHCCKMIRDEQLEQLDLSSIRLIVNGSEPLRAETIDRFIQRFGPCGFRPEKMFPSYGLAEATLFVTGEPYGKPARRVAVDATTSEPAPPPHPQHIFPSKPVEKRAKTNYETDSDSKWAVSCGAAPPSIRVVIVDPETKTSCPEGKIGQVWVSSPANGSGYWGNEELSQQTFQNFMTCGDGPFLNTGDLGFLLEGELFVTGREKDLIILRGRNLYPQDIERVAERVLPFIEANTCAAVSFQGPTGEQLALVVEANRELVRIARKAKADGRLDDLLREYVEPLRQAIGDEFETTLHKVAYLLPGTFPRTSSGKVQRHRCLNAFQVGNEDVVFQWQQRLVTNPDWLLLGTSKKTSNDTGPTVDDAGNRASWNGDTKSTTSLGDSQAKTLASTLHRFVLKWVKDEVDDSIQSIAGDAPFTTMGIDSIGAALISLDLQKETGISLTPDLLYQFPTINQLASYLAKNKPSALVASATGATNGDER